MSSVTVGLFICECGGKISSILPSGRLLEQARRLPSVIVARRLRYACSPDGLSAIRQAIASEKLDRVLVAGCTPRLLARRFRLACREAGLDDDLFELVDIREGCAWVHRDEPEAASAKALDLVRMGVARVARRRSREPVVAEVTPAALVIGGGLAGMTAALILAEAGLPVTLVERRAALGGTAGLARRVGEDAGPAAESIERKATAIRSHPRIRLLLQSQVAAVSGTVGRYTATITGPHGNCACDVGAIIVATGARSLVAGELPHGESGDGNGHRTGDGEPSPAMFLSSQPDASVLAHLLDLPQDANGFFPEVRCRLRPGSWVERGIYICGAAHAPTTPAETEFQATSAALRAVRHLRSGTVCSVAPAVRVDEDLCSGCGTCVGVCGSGAIRLHPREEVLSVSRVDPLRCTGCGSCAVACPAKAIDLSLDSESEMLAQIQSALADTPADGRLRILAFGCAWSAQLAAELAGARGLTYPAAVRPIQLSCSARLDPLHVLWAFHCGADGVFVGACPPGQCHHGGANRHADDRIAKLQTLLAASGFEARRLCREWITPDDPHDLVTKISAFTDRVRWLSRGERPA